MGRKINERVGAILSSKEGVVQFLGYGKYLGNLVPETDDVKFFGMSLKEKKISNACIQLDSGKKIYGCECWWASEKEVKDILNGAKEIQTVDIEDYRRECNEAGVE